MQYTRRIGVKKVTIGGQPPTQRCSRRDIGLTRPVPTRRQQAMGGGRNWLISAFNSKDLEGNVLCAFPKGFAAKRTQRLEPLGDGQKMISSERPSLARKMCSAIPN